MAEVADFQVSGPFTHENLSIFLIHGEEQLKGGTFLTLQEAIEQEKLVVHETGSVSVLAVENVAVDEEVFIESGEIVKGGRQDRVLVTDVVIPAKSGKVPIAAFCVEQGRWSGRGGEDEATFSGSSSTVASKEMRFGTRVSKSQADVWSSVSGLQKKLARKLGKNVQDRRSRSSLQLTLEDKGLREKAGKFMEILSRLPDDKEDVIGFAFAINGEVNTAGVYGTRILFRKLWPKILEASAVEAVAEQREKEKFAPAAVEDVKTFLLEPERGEVSEEEVTKRIKVVKRETKTNVLFETLDAETPTGWLHRAYLKK